MKRLQVTGLGHAYALEAVLADIDFTLSAGEVLALVGPSGCGKTTLLHLCAGLLLPREGRLESDFERPALMFQQPRLLPWQSTRDNIALGLRAEGMPRADARARATAIGHTLGLDDRALDAYPHKLSGGMQSRAALGRALVVGPDLLMMDEPFSALDIGLKTQLHRLLLAHRDLHDVAVLMITHDLLEAVRLADTVLVLGGSPGRVVHGWRSDLPAKDRSDMDVHRFAAGLLQVPPVRAAFDLPQTPDGGGQTAAGFAWPAVETIARRAC